MAVISARFYIAPSYCYVLSMMDRRHNSDAVRPVQTRSMVLQSQALTSSTIETAARVSSEEVLTARFCDSREPPNTIGKRGRRIGVRFPVRHYCVDQRKPLASHVWELCLRIGALLHVVVAIICSAVTDSCGIVKLDLYMLSNPWSGCKPRCWALSSFDSGQSRAIRCGHNVPAEYDLVEKASTRASEAV